MMEGTMAPPALAVGFWTRFLAYIIDAIVLSIIGFALGFALAFTDLGFLAIQLVSMLVGWTYFVYFESSEMQATPGKMALGAKVVGNEGNRISVGTAILRNVIGKLISAIVLLIGFFMIGFHADKKGLHDLIAGTRVVKA